MLSLHSNFSSMRTKEYKVWQLQFISEDGESINERINEYEDLLEDETIEDYIEERKDELYDSTDVEWECKITNTESIRI